MASKSNKPLARYKRNNELDWMPEPSRKGVLMSLLKHPLPLVAKTENQAHFMEALQDKAKTHVLASGCAGTGKTFLALIAALNLLRQGDNEFEEIIILKSVKELEGESIGFLPGDKDEKLQYVYMSYYMQLERILKKEIFDELKTKEFIKILPIGAIRGFSISKNSIVIVDETQNLSEDNTYTVMTRMEAKAKLIVIGDVFQRDRTDDNDNGLVFAVDMMKKMKAKLAGTPMGDAISITEFTKEDSVRSPFIQHLQGLYEDHLNVRQETADILKRQREKSRSEKATVNVEVTNTLDAQKSIRKASGLFSFLRS